MPWRPALALLLAGLLTACGASAPAAGKTSNNPAAPAATLQVDVAGLCCAGPGFLAVHYANVGSAAARDVLLALRPADQDRSFALMRGTVIPAATDPREVVWRLPDLQPGESGDLYAWLPMDPGAASGAAAGLLGSYRAVIQAEDVRPVLSRIYDQNFDKDNIRRDPDVSGTATFSAVGRRYEIDFLGRHQTVLGPAPEDLLRLGGGRHRVRGIFAAHNILVVLEISAD